MSHTHRILARVTCFVTIGVTLALGSLPPQASADNPVETASGPLTGTAIEYALSRPARELPAPMDGPADAFRPPRINPLAHEPDGGKRGTWHRRSGPADPLISSRAHEGVRTPALDFDFAGVGNPEGCGGCSPPDTNGDVGPSHYVQMVNATKVAVFSKTGVLLAPAFNLGSLWPAGTCSTNAGDPIVVYDPLADRWVLSQFADPTHMCFAVSQTADPLGSYHLYTFNVGSFPDYFKVGVWSDAYYMGANEATYTAYAFDRAKMLVGDVSASFVKFTGQTNFLLPADLDGPTAPPAGSPGRFYTFKDNAFHGGVDRIELFALDVDFTNPGLSTFTLTASLPVMPFTYTVCGFFNFNCARQLGTTQRLDVVSEWPMHRFPYRNFGSHQTLLGNFTVGGGSGNVGAAIRWFELRDTGSGWTLFQQGTHDPGDGHDRFMGSIAMDGSGNIALGYSVSSTTLFPGIRYATRTPGDPAGTLQAEAVLINGGGSQTGSNRWGDYAAMSVDPVDDCRFWYTNEYYPVTASTAWKTRIGVFKFPSCAEAPAPSISSLSPASAFAGDPAFTLTVFGAGFVPTSGVTWNGGARPTGFVDATQLQATIASGDIAAVGSNEVRVVTPPPGGGTSNPATFSVIAPDKDLVITGLGLTPASVPARGSLRAGYQVKNQGTTTVTEAYVERVYLSTQATLDGSAVLLSQTQPGDTDLGPGATLANTVGLLIPSGTTPGNYFLLVQADGSGVVAESNEANNVSAVPLKVTPVMDCPATILIDNLAPGVTSSSVSFTGTWALSGVPGGHGGSSLESAGGGLDTYTWTTPVLSGTYACTYQVSMTWTSAPTRGSAVPYTVSGQNGGPVTKTFDQRVNDRQSLWHGTYTFPAGAQGVVTVTDAGGQASADAVFFSLVGASLDSGAAATTTAGPKGRETTGKPARFGPR